MFKTVLPGSTLGILGSGQLGRMLAMAAKRMGYQVHVYSPDKASPAGQVSDFETTAAYEDTDALKAFAQRIDVLTLEFENIPVSALETLTSWVPIHPGPAVLQIAQHRLREKTFLSTQGFPVAAFCEVSSEAMLHEGLQRLGMPAVLKTAGFGYDGKGQTRIQREEDVSAAFAALAGQPGILEAFVPFEKEVSVVAARNSQGAFAHYGVVENIHRHHILDFTLAPGRVSEKTQAEAVSMTQALMEKLGVVGVLCVEFFVMSDGTLWVNEMAPRPHNSGHFTIEATRTSQFEQQLRAVCGLPLGSTEFVKPAAAMVNLLGDLWHGGEPDWEALLSLPEVTLHLYGKKEPRPGRKMGHITVIDETLDAAYQKVQQARDCLRMKSMTGVLG